MRTGFKFYGILSNHYSRTDPSIRANAILLCGPPITQLPTARLFAYATHYDCPPLGLEWVDDETCVLVYETVSQARTAFDRLTRSPGVSAEGYVTAKTFPASLWPPDERVRSPLPTEDAR